MLLFSETLLRLIVINLNASKTACMQNTRFKILQFLNDALSLTRILRNKILGYNMRGQCKGISHRQLTFGLVSFFAKKVQFLPPAMQKGDSYSIANQSGKVDFFFSFLLDFRLKFYSGCPRVQVVNRRMRYINRDKARDANLRCFATAINEHLCSLYHRLIRIKRDNGASNLRCGL